VVVSLDKESIVEYVKKRLGYPVVNIELPDDSIEAFIEESLITLSSYTNETDFVSKSISGEYIDVSDVDLIDVVRLYESPEFTGTLDYSNIDIFKVKDYSGLVDRTDFQVRYSQIDRMTLKDFKLVGDKLYIDNYHGRVVIEYIPKVSLENLDTQEQGWTRDFTLALSKEALGRIRSKYNISQAPYELDGRELLSEAQEERRSLLERLERGTGFFFATR